MHILRLLSLVAVLAMAGCGGGTAEPTTTTTTAPNAEPTTTTAPDVPPAELLDLIRADAAEVGGVAPGEVVIDLTEQVEWSDGSLGCPEPGLNYTLAIVPGFRITVQVGGEFLYYHTDSQDTFVRCEDGRPAR